MRITAGFGIIFALAFVDCCFALVSGVTVGGQVQRNAIIKEYEQLSCNLKVVLHDGMNVFESFVTNRGTFSIPNVPVGKSYRLMVESIRFSFHTYRVDISEDNQIIYFPISLAVDWHAGGALLKSDGSGGNILIEAFENRNFFEKREKFSIFSLLMNPMIIMALLSFGMMYYMPKMMEGMDPEALEELRQSQAAAPNLNNLPDFSSTLANMFSSSSSDTAVATNSNSSPSTSAGSARKRRR